MKSNSKMKNIFADKATLILRKMICQPDRKWVVRDFIGPEDVSLGMTQGVLEAMAMQGYIERVKKGPNSYALLANKERLIDNWLREYRFELNQIDTYYSPDKNILKKVKAYLEEDKYALTLHSGANVITSYVSTEEVYLYVDTNIWDKDILRIIYELQLKELTKGGNIHIIRPYYKNSVFFNCQEIKGYKVVSNLQLYLDLYHFQPRGREHAEYLKKILEERGKRLE